MRIHATEAQNQQAIMELLAAYGIFAGRLNTGAGFVKGRPVMHHTFGSGCADILAFVVLPIEESQLMGDTLPAKPHYVGGIKPLWIEVKAGKGGKQSETQKNFQRHVQSKGHWYIVVDSPDALMLRLRQAGVLP